MSRFANLLNHIDNHHTTFTSDAPTILSPSEFASLTGVNTQKLPKNNIITSLAQSQSENIN